MYLAKQIKDGNTLYFIRESYFSENRWKSRDLVALGEEERGLVDARLPRAGLVSLGQSHDLVGAEFVEGDVFAFVADLDGERVRV